MLPRLRSHLRSISPTHSWLLNGPCFISFSPSFRLILLVPSSLRGPYRKMIRLDLRFCLVLNDMSVRTLIDEARQQRDRE